MAHSIGWGSLAPCSFLKLTDPPVGLPFPKAMAGWVQPSLEVAFYPTNFVFGALWEHIWIICLPGYSAKQEFVSLTTMPEARKLRGEKRFPEDTKVSTSPVPLTGTLLSLGSTAQWPCHMAAASPSVSRRLLLCHCSQIYSAGWEFLIWKSSVWKLHNLKLSTKIASRWKFPCHRALFYASNYLKYFLLLRSLLNATLLPNA